MTSFKNLAVVVFFAVALISFVAAFPAAEAEEEGLDDRRHRPPHVHNFTRPSRPTRPYRPTRPWTKPARPEPTVNDVAEEEAEEEESDGRRHRPTRPHNFTRPTGRPWTKPPRPEPTVNDEADEEDAVEGDTRVTCDLLSGMGIGPISLGEHTLCAMHCGQRYCKSGGSCQNGVCVCRKDPASCWIYLCKGCKW